MSDLNVIRPEVFKSRPRLVHDSQKQARTRAEIARDKIEEGFAELRAAAGADVAQECLRFILLTECTP